MNVLDLFSGIGGFSLGLERAGMRTVAFCEIKPYCRSVLRKHWPSVPIYEDVTTLTGDALRADGISVDVICGGFPCQDISIAGKGAGIDGERSGLWREYRRIIGEVRPAVVIIENSPALRTRGADRVVSDLEALDYTGEPIVVGAVHAGAPHRRQRVWIVAYSNRIAREQGWPHNATQGARGWDADRGRVSAHVAHTDVFHGDDGRHGASALRKHQPPLLSIGQQWSFEPDVGRVAHGISSRSHRIEALGNAVVPQVPELIGRAIMSVAPYLRTEPASPSTPENDLG